MIVWCPCIDTQQRPKSPSAEASSFVNGLHLTATVTEQSVMWEEEILFLTLRKHYRNTEKSNTMIVPMITLQPERRAELLPSKGILYVWAK